MIQREFQRISTVAIVRLIWLRMSLAILQNQRKTKVLFEPYFYIAKGEVDKDAKLKQIYYTSNLISSVRYGLLPLSL